MGSRLYSRFIELVQKWPIDRTRTGRDLGERLRKLVSEEFPQGPITKVNESQLSAELDSFIRLSNNVYYNRYPRKFINSTATGLDHEKLKAITSTEGLEIFSPDRKSQSRLSKLKNFGVKSE